jgi:phosphomannomutase/phosphoglucomutase
LRTHQALGSARLILRDVVTIDGVRAVFDDGWGLIRASNTQPALVLRFEATSLQRLEAIRAVVEGELSAAKRALGY